MTIKGQEINLRIFSIIQIKEIILCTELIKNPCIQLLVKSSKVTLPFYIYIFWDPAKTFASKKNAR
jgi:hypothetical protein